MAGVGRACGRRPRVGPGRRRRGAATRGARLAAKATLPGSGGQGHRAER